ncbi:hypothetical protein BASA81_008384 [Batrachochytrium salamandrivorans]|nr:hypothetical protein BASA81_008384 [Batrachochytrium salamandrivorans]
MSKLRTMVIMGSTRAGRNGDRVGKFFKQIAQARTAVQLDYVDLLDENLPLMDNAIAYTPADKVTPQLQGLAKRVAEAEAFVLISPEYNHSMSPALVNFFESLPLTSYGYKPAAIAVYSMGPFGGVRAAMQMRALTGELGCTAINKLFAAPVVHTSLDVDGKPVGDNGKLLVNLANQQFDQLEWVAEALKNHRAVKPLPK